VGMGLRSFCQTASASIEAGIYCGWLVMLIGPDRVAWCLSDGVRQNRARP
jgi:hypothetical protein